MCTPTGTHCCFLAGFRYLSLSEQLGTNETVSDLPTGLANNQDFAFAETFSTTNRFYGGQVGVGVGFSVMHMSLDMAAKVAVGRTQETANLAGGTRITDQATGALLAQASDRALLVQPTNIGSASFSRTAVVPEADLTLVVDFNGRVHFFAGYTFLYWSNVARPGDQIDRVISIQPVPAVGTTSPPQLGVARPSLPSVQNSSFWAQGLNVGFEFRF
jgi:hypothetical protein